MQPHRSKNVIACIFMSWIMVVLNACAAQPPQRNPAEYFENPQVIALAEAASEGNVEAITTLVQNGVDINKTGKDNFTPLTWLLNVATPPYPLPNKAGFDALLENGADPLIPFGDRGRTALYLAALNDKDIYYLEKILALGVNVDFAHEGHSSRPTALYAAINVRSADHVRLLIEHGADIEYKNALGNTPLLYTITNNWEVAFILLEAGADYTAKDTTGATLVHYIENNRYYPNPGEIDWREKVVEFLRERGVEVKPWEPSEH